MNSSEHAQTAPAITGDAASEPGLVAAALRVGLGRVNRRLRQIKADGGLTLPEASALARLDRWGPATAAELARHEQVSPQSIGATLHGLAQRGLIERTADPADGRRQILSLTQAGAQLLHIRRSERTEQFAIALADHFSAEERALLANAAPLLERLAEHL